MYNEYDEYYNDIYLDIYPTFGSTSVSDPKYAEQLLNERGQNVR